MQHSNGIKCISHYNGIIRPWKMVGGHFNLLLYFTASVSDVNLICLNEERHNSFHTMITFITVHMHCVRHRKSNAKNTQLAQNKSP